MKNRRFCIYLTISIILTIIYGFYIVCYFKNKVSSTYSDKIQREELSFDYEEMLSELRKIEEKNDSNISFLSYCKEKASWLAIHQYRKECYLLFAELHRVFKNQDPELLSWYYSSMMMQALEVSTALDKMNFVYNAVDGFQSITENNNFICACIKIETYLSLPSFFSDQINEAFICLKQLCTDIESEKEYTITNSCFEQVQTHDFSYINQLIATAEHVVGINKVNKSILSECKKIIEEIQK